MKRVLAGIPFSGFYYSPHDIDLEDLCYGDESSKKTVKAYEKICMSDNFSWKECYIEYIKSCYIPKFVELISDSIGYKLKDKEIIFESLEMPSEYNFVTDQIFVYCSQKLIKKMYKKCISSEENMEIMDEVCESMFKSRDGFISFYDYRWNEWGDVIMDWDYNQYKALFLAAIFDGQIPFELEHIDEKYEYYENCLYSGAIKNKGKKLVDNLLDSIRQDYEDSQKYWDERMKIAN